MKRGYTALEFKDKVRRLRAVRPDISISSDFIVGFPGETERDFAATLRAGRARWASTSRSASSTAAAPARRRRRSPTRSTRRRSRQRLARLQAQLERRRAPSASAWSAACSACWSSGRAKKDARELAGRTENNRWVNFAGPASLIGRFVDVTITEALAHSLRGRLADAARARARAAAHAAASG